MIRNTGYRIRRYERREQRMVDSGGEKEYSTKKNRSKKSRSHEVGFFYFRGKIHLHRSPVTAVMEFKDAIFIKTNLLDT
jgi:hypothetical protein